MKPTRLAAKLRVLAGATLVLTASTSGRAQENAQDRPEAAAPKVLRRTGSPDSLQAIHDEFNQQVLQLERQRLDRLARLAERQDASDAAATYEQLFRLAIASNMFQEAEQAAAAVVKTGTPSPTTAALAHLVKIIAEADRGAYEQSLESLKQAFDTAQKAAASGRPRATLQAGEIEAICDAYYQRLVHSGQYKIARQAFQLAVEHARNPGVQEFLAGRLKRLDLVGKPAPPSRGPISTASPSAWPT